MYIRTIIKILVMTGCAATLLLMSNQVLEHLQRQHQMFFASGLLDHEIKLSEHIASALHDAGKYNAKDCSETSINRLKGIRKNYRYIDDIGVLKGRDIICTAVWGGLSKPINLASPAYITPHGYQLYQPVKANNYTKDYQSMTAMNNIVVFNSMLTVTDFMQVLPDFAIALTTRNQKRVFFSSGHFSSQKKGLWSRFFTVRTISCSRTKDLCVSTYNPQGGLKMLSWWALTLVISFAILCGWILASFMERWFRDLKSVENRFIKALKKNELYTVYQPIVRVDNGHTVSLEALVRWNDSHFGQVSPELFVCLAEKLGLYKLLSEMVVERALTEIEPLLRNISELQLSLNVGDEEIKDTGYLQRLKRLCFDKSILASQIKLEITERCRAEYDEIATFCLRARQKGFSISLDDFGTGMSNIAWLTEFHFDEIKIDKLLVKNINIPDNRLMLVSLVHTLIKTGKKMVFEGIENQEQMELIRAINPDSFIQGWYAGRPVSVSEVKDRLNAELSETSRQ